MVVKAYGDVEGSHWQAIARSALKTSLKKGREFVEKKSIVIELSACGTACLVPLGSTKLGVDQNCCWMSIVVG